MIKSPCWLPFVCLAILAAVACSGGSSSDSTTDSTDQQLSALLADGTIAVGTTGDVATMKVDTDNLVYGYRVTESSVGNVGLEDYDTLVKNSDGTYSPSADPTTHIIDMPDAFVVADIPGGAGGVDQVLASVPAPTASYTLADVEGVYNFILYMCDSNLTSGSCTAGFYADIGTVRINGDNTLDYCLGYDILTMTSSCNYDDGVYRFDFVDNGDATFTVTSDGDEIASFNALVNANGVNLIVANLKNRPIVSQGPGIVILVRQQSIASLDLVGKYYFNGTYGNFGYADILANDTFTGWETEDGNTTTLDGLVYRDDPWLGMLRATPVATPGNYLDDGLVIIHPETRTYVESAWDLNDADWIDIGGAF